jgi:hypothetical protein
VMFIGKDTFPLVPAEAGTQCFGQGKEELDSRFCGNERRL